MHIRKDWAMAGNDQLRVEALDQIQGLRNLVEAAVADNFGENDAKTMTPECISGDQCSRAGLEEDHGVHVMARSRMDFPVLIGQLNRDSWLQQGIKREARTQLPGRQIAERLFVPRRNGISLTRRNQCLQRSIPCLKGGVAAAVVTVQMSIEQELQ